MLPPTHFIVALLFALIGVKLNYFSYNEAFIIALLSMLIDVDHLFYFFFKHKKWNIRKAWNAATVKHEQESSFIQHKSGFIIVTIILLILSFIHLHLSLIFAVAYYTHFLLDHIHVKFISKYKLLKIKDFVVPINNFEIIINIATVFLILLYFSITFYLP